ncbi:MAG: DNA internalization-related competence protein ComEC/Rec2 [Rhodothermia bacterium]|nr:MAG: DNA internalization-related competence protein ComEC/Rec2 [Rhodothermia bacterium]
MKYPALFAGLLVGQGVLLARAPSSWLLPLCLFGFGVAAFFYLLARRLEAREIVNLSPLLYVVASILVVVGSSFLNSVAQSSADPQDISHWSANEPFVEIEGRIRRLSERRSGLIDSEIDVRSFVFDSVRWESRGRVLIRSLPPRADFHPGDVVRVSGSLHGLPVKRNPYDFDTAMFYRRLGISAELVSGGSAMKRVQHLHGGVVYGFENLRMRIASRINRVHHSAASKEILPALLLGDRSNISFEARTAFRESGLSHLLAISGLHVGIIGMSLYFMVGLWLARIRITFIRLKAIRSAVTGVALIGFVLLSGGSPSVQRAVAMATVFLLSTALGKTITGWNMLGLAGCFLIGVDPSQIYAPGFQLSFSAVAGILLLQRNSSLSSDSGRRIPRPFRFLWATSKISIAVTCSTLPVLLYHFGAAPLGGILANILAIPLTSILLLSGIISSAVGSTLSFVEATDVLANTLFSLAKAASQVLEGASLAVSTGIVHPASIVPVSLLMAFRSVGRRKRTWLLLVSIALLLISSGPRPNILSATFLDVGQGDAALFLTPEGNTVLVDAGTGFSSARSIQAHLSGLGIDRVDLLVISHFHADHVGGLDHLREEVTISRVVGPRNPDEYGGLIEIVSRGDSLFVDPTVFIEVLAPPGGSSTRTENESSVVIRIVYGERSFLMAGDAERSIETGLVSAYGWSLKSDVVKVAHHGSSTSSSPSFVLRSSPSAAVISVGRRNRFDHPDPQVIRRWRETAYEVSTTAIEGGISFSTDGKSIWRSQ